MFVSQPQYEFPFPPALEQPGAQHWRMVELTLHAPWFLLSVEIVDPNEPEHRMTRTLCIAWEHDLADAIRSLDAARVKGIVCMMPAWQSATGQWSSREISEVWLCRSASGQHVVLCDVEGQKFDCGLIPEHAEPVQQELLLQLKPKRPATRQRPPQPGGRRSRRAARDGNA